MNNKDLLNEGLFKNLKLKSVVPIPLDIYKSVSPTL